MHLVGLYTYRKKTHRIHNVKLILGLFVPGLGGTTILRNVERYLPNNKVSLPRRFQSPSTALWWPRSSHTFLPSSLFKMTRGSPWVSKLSVWPSHCFSLRPPSDTHVNAAIYIHSDRKKICLLWSGTSRCDKDTQVPEKQPEIGIYFYFNSFVSPCIFCDMSVEFSPRI